MELDDINSLQWWQSYLSNKNNYIKNNDRILYIWKYIPNSKIESIQSKVSKDIVKDFTIPVIYNDYDEYWEVLEISKDIYDEFCHNLPETNIKENAHEHVTVEINHHIKNIHRFLYDTLYDKFLFHYNKDPNQEIYESINELYREIEDIVYEDINQSIETEKQKKHISHFLNKKQDKIKNNLIAEKIDNIFACIHSFISQLDENTQTTLLSNPHRKWRSKLIKESKKYLFERYHKDEIQYLEYKGSLDLLNDSIEQIYLSLIDEIPEDKSDEQYSKEVFHIERLRKGLLDYLKKINKKPTTEEIDNILEEIDEQLFDPFIRDYYELDNDDDTGSESKTLSADFSNIQNYIEELLTTIEYKNIAQKNTTLWIEEIVEKLLCGDEINFQQLSAYQDQYLKEKISQEQLQQLLKIVTENENYDFAIRIRDILKDTTKNL